MAGEAGYALERFFDTPLAAMKIMDASSSLPKVSPVRFYETNDEAMADIKRMAELEACEEWRALRATDTSAASQVKP